MISFIGCKFLIFDRDRIGMGCKLRSLPGGFGAYWERNKSVLPDESCAVNVQFCELRGRVRGKVSCLRGMAECSSYEDYEHSVDCISES